VFSNGRIHLNALEEIAMNMTCSRCGGTLEYEPIKFDVYDANGAQQSGKHAGAAFNAGDPLLAAAHIGYRLTMLAVKEVRRHTQSSFKCQSCGRRGT
jgi:hypothetical protein